VLPKPDPFCYASTSSEKNNHTRTDPLVRSTACFYYSYPDHATIVSLPRQARIAIPRLHQGPVSTEAHHQGNVSANQLALSSPHLGVPRVLVHDQVEGFQSAERQQHLLHLQPLYKDKLYTNTTCEPIASLHTPHGTLIVYRTTVESTRLELGAVGVFWRGGQPFQLREGCVFPELFQGHADANRAPFHGALGGDGVPPLANLSTLMQHRSRRVSGAQGGTPQGITKPNGCPVLN
jgi:hypothetical protein